MPLGLAERAFHMPCMACIDQTFYLYQRKVASVCSLGNPTLALEDFFDEFNFNFIDLGFDFWLIAHNNS